MNNAISISNKNELIGPEEIKILKQSLWPTFTDAEMNYSVAICNQLQLNPLLKQIHFVKRNTKNGPVITAQTGIDGFRLTADRTGKYAGSDDAIFEYGNDKVKPLKATVTVYKMMDGQRCAFTAAARWEEYYQPIGGQWDKMPHVMLSKCAEALALRKAFPAELSALRSEEEMQQADRGANKAQEVQDRIESKENDIPATATVVGEPEEPAEPEPLPICTLCGAEMKMSRAGTSYYCPNFNDKSSGEHPRIKV